MRRFQNRNQLTTDHTDHTDKDGLVLPYPFLPSVWVCEGTRYAGSPCGKFLIIALLLVFITTQIFPLDFSDPGDPEILAQNIVNAMSDEQALAQTFMLGWVGSAPSPLIMEWIHDRHIGGVKIFGWNTGDTLRLAETVGALQSAALEGPYKIPLLVATDQEGGWIRHVKGSTSETPGNMAIGASGFPLDAYRAGFYIGRELALLGINMNFAPAVDLYTNRGSTLIGPRAFGSDPVQAGILGAAFAKGQKESGIIATAKHYPGHGDTELDSHGVLPQINADFTQLWNRELVPFRLLSREGVPAVMSGHLAFPNTPAGSTPASLSPWFLKNILRDQIGFRGIVITDDLMMNGATTFAGSVSLAAKQALQAGNDIILFSKTPALFDPLWTSLVSAMKQEDVFRNRVRDAARRIVLTKLEYLRGEKSVPPVPDLKKVLAGIPDPEGQNFFMDLAARSATLVSGGDVFPLYPETAGKVVLAGRYAEFFDAGKRAYPGAVSCPIGTAVLNSEFMRNARSADTVIFCLAEEADLRILQNVKPLGKRTIIFSILSPVYLDGITWADGALAVYSYAAESFTAGFSAMLGRIRPQGKMPFPLNEPWAPPGR